MQNSISALISKETLSIRFLTSDEKQEKMATNKMDMNVKKGIVYAQNYIGGEFEDAAAGYVDSHNPVCKLNMQHISLDLVPRQGGGVS